jgi:hypothetical protein
MAELSLAELRAELPKLIAARDAAATRKERRALSLRVRSLRSLIAWIEGRPLR